MRLMRFTLGLLWLSGVTFATDYALVIGCCGEYKSLQGKNLGGTSRDAYVMADIFNKDCKKKNIKVLVNADATKSKIKEQLKWYKNHLGRGDKLFFYFSGHGARAGDKQVFLTGISGDADLNQRLNKTALVTYDFNPKDAYNTAIISADDLRPTFLEMDRNGVKIVMFVDACFAGRAYKRGYVDETMKLFDSVETIESKQPLNNKLYNHLIFFGASLSSLQAREIRDKNGNKRGEFTLYLEYCLKTGDRDGNQKITKEELQHCMVDEFPNFATSSSVYPAYKLEGKTILSSSHQSPSNKEQLNVKYDGTESLKGIVRVVNKGYELEIVANGRVYNIYKASMLYATVAKHKLPKYLRAYRLFALKGDDGTLLLDYKSESTGTLEDTFCKDEIIKIRTKNLGNRHLIALTIDQNGRVIMLKTKRDFVRTQVTPPYDGIDRVKLFAFNNQTIYNKTLKYQNNNSGVISGKDIDVLYQMLKNEKSLKGQGFIIRTTSKCKR